MANDKNLDQLADDELDSLIGRKLAMLSRAEALVEEDKALIGSIASQLAEAELDEQPLATITELQQLLDARTAHYNGRRGALVSAQRALDHVEAERQRRREVGVEASARDAREALADFARSMVADINEAASTITTMLKELRARAQACRDADLALRQALKVNALPDVLRLFDPYADDLTLEQVEPGTAEVARILERFVNGDLNAQMTQRLAAEARARARA
jgi:hypothetical protein